MSQRFRNGAIQFAPNQFSPVSCTPKHQPTDGKIWHTQMGDLLAHNSAQENIEIQNK